MHFYLASILIQPALIFVGTPKAFIQASAFFQSSAIRPAPGKLCSFFAASKSFKQFWISLQQENNVAYW